MSFITNFIVLLYPSISPICRLITIVNQYVCTRINRGWQGGDRGRGPGVAAPSALQERQPAVYISLTASPFSTNLRGIDFFSRLIFVEGRSDAGHIFFTSLSGLCYIITMSFINRSFHLISLLKPVFGVALEWRDGGGDVK